MRANLKNPKPNRNKVLPPCRVSDAEFLAFKQNAKKAGMGFSEFQRQALNNVAVIVRAPVADAKTFLALSKIGNNLNQLVHKSHIHDKVDIEKMRDILIVIDMIIMDGIIGVGSDSEGQ